MRQVSATFQDLVSSIGGLIKALVIRAFNLVGERDTPPKDYLSRRPCPACGGRMVYHPTRWSSLTGKYLRICQGCGCADPRPIKMVRQI